MRLDSVQIRNFRSIKEIEVKFDPACRVLVGINESGKSNILRALSLLDNDTDPDKNDDLREALPNESPVKDSYVRFIFRFEKDESDEILNAVSDKILAATKNPEIVSKGTRKIKLKEFCQDRQGLYVVDVIPEKKRFSQWNFRESHKLLQKWKKPSDSCPQDFKVTVNDEQHQLSQFSLVRESDLQDVPAGYLEDADIEDFSGIIGDAITEVTKANLPEVLFWEYSEDNLLPSSVKIAEFSEKPDTCLPLKNMFALAGISDIKSSIQTARAGTDNQFQNYLNRIARQTTKHFKSVWKEYKDIEFSLRLNADQIVPGVKEENTHDFARRSDGFKRFVTFLLMISVNVKTDNLQNTLLLIDEPDISLHPTGARYLRDELIRISRKNQVVYSTHSIFMIDSGDIGRHYIVKKKNEVTSIEEAQASNIADEEVLFNALGHSVFAIIKPKNIIFEGWTDKHLFEIALESGTLELKRKFKEVGRCHAKGAKAIKTITPMIELARRSCLVISDSDEPSKQHKKLYEQDRGFGEWKTYQDLGSDIEAVTAEDFLDNEFISKQISKVLPESMPRFDKSALPDRKGKVAALMKWMTDNGMTIDQAKDMLHKMKSVIFENLKSRNVEATYTAALKGISL